VQIHHGDCLAILPTLAPESVDAVVTDPPYGLEFMGNEWDGSDGFRRSLNEADVGRKNTFGRMSARAPEYRAGHLFQEWCEAWAVECLRVLKPGGHMLAFGSTRTYHRLACGIEDAGFEIRDQIQWIYATGFPKSRASLKPAHEPIAVARKPMIGTIDTNEEKYGTGAFNINGCRIGEPDAARTGGREGEQSAARRYTDKGATNFAAMPGPRGGSPAGRWPANVITDGSGAVIAAFPKSAGQQGDLKPTGRARPTKHAFGDMAPPLAHEARGDTGSAARFFYTTKADKADRLGSKHPTVKPVDLIAYLCRLITPAGGVVLDLFAGSGTTGMACLREGFDAILIEQKAEYVTDIERRVAHVSGTDSPLFAAAK
jgi:DNA modification methylase